jgi:hypothetical protein
MTLEEILNAWELSEFEEADDQRDYRWLPTEEEGKEQICVKLFRFIITIEFKIIFGSNIDREDCSHSALNKGKHPVLAAGEVGVSKKGKLIFISNLSGHFHPNFETVIELVIPYLSALG